MSIKKLAETLKAEITSHRAAVVKRQTEVRAVISEAGLILSDWDTETEHGLRVIQAHREKQVSKEFFVSIRHFLFVI